MIVLGNRIAVLSRTTTLLWDMDGVLLDTLKLDLEIINRLLDQRVLDHPNVPPRLIRKNFAYDPSEFWRRILESIGVSLTADEVTELVCAYEEIRRVATPSIHTGISEILDAAHGNGFSMAVVSNNPESDVVRILSNAGLTGYFVEIVGNDCPGLSKKAHPDPYLEGARRLSVVPSRCTAVEDSSIGAESAGRAGCVTVGVATGANTAKELWGSSFVWYCYENFAEMLPS